MKPPGITWSVPRSLRPPQRTVWAVRLQIILPMTLCAAGYGVVFWAVFPALHGRPPSIWWLLGPPLLFYGLVGVAFLLQELLNRFGPPVQVRLTSRSVDRDGTVRSWSRYDVYEVQPVDFSPPDEVLVLRSSSQRFSVMLPRNSRLLEVVLWFVARRLRPADETDKAEQEQLRSPDPPSLVQWAMLLSASGQGVGVAMLYRETFIDDGTAFWLLTLGAVLHGGVLVMLIARRRYARPAEYGYWWIWSVVCGVLGAMIGGILLATHMFERFAESGTM